MDPVEVEKFKLFAEDWWDKTVMKVLFSLNEVRIPEIVEGLKSFGLTKEYATTSRPLEGVNILDVGCGGGILSEALARLGANVVGVDGVEQVIDVAKEHASRDKSLKNLSYIASSAQDLGDEHTEKYDAVIASEVLDHCFEKETFIKAAARCLKPGGIFYMSHIAQTFMSSIFVIGVPENVLNYIPKGSHDYHMLIRFEDTEKFLNKYNCTTKKLKGMYYDYFNDKWVMLKSPSMWYCLTAVKDS